jgi:putative transcriptional regulator
MTASFKQEMSMFESIQQGLKESIDFSKGKPVKAIEHDVSSPDVKAVREHVGMTQAEFASAFGSRSGTLRRPRGPVLVLLNVVAKEPKVVLRALSENGLERQRISLHNPSCDIYHCFFNK